MAASTGSRYLDTDEAMDIPAMNWPALRQKLERLVRFGISGVLAVSTDVLVTSLLTRYLDMNPLYARIAAIALATVVGWLAHRRITFSVAGRPTWNEFARYVGVAWLSIVTNYSVFAVLVSFTETTAEIAIVLSSLVAMFVAFFGMKFLVFRARGAENN